MTPHKRRRLYFILGTMVSVAFSLGMLLTFFEEAVVFFYTPSELSSKTPQQLSRTFRLGGLVVAGSVHHRVEGQTPVVTFDVSDGEGVQTVSYTGVLPDLFRQGQGIVAEGRLQSVSRYLSGQPTVFQATTVLAKHDEKYTPPPLKKALNKPTLSETLSLETPPTSDADDQGGQA